MKYTLPLALLTSLIVCASAHASPGLKTSMAAPKNDIVLESEATPHLSVVFNHKDHTSVGCDVCHHKPRCVICHFNSKSNQPPNASCSSAGCHPDKGRTQEAGSRFMAFHKRSNDRSCFGCHSSSGKYEGCTPCHNDTKTAQPK